MPIPPTHLIPSPTPSYMEDDVQPSSSRPTPTPTPSPSPDPNGRQLEQQPVLFVNPDGSAQQGHWPRDVPSIPASTKGKRRAQEADDLHQQRDKHVRRRDLAVSDSLAPSLHPRVTYPDCNELGNAVLSCFPESNTTVTQGDWTKFVWNARIPEFIGLPGSVDIYLYHADSGQKVMQWSNIPNVQNSVNVPINDSFWDYRMLDWTPGHNKSYTYYYVIVKAGTTLTGGEEHQATWTAVQTAYATSYIASMSSASVSSTSAVASSISALGPASASYLSVSSVSSQSVASAGPAAATDTAGLQNSGDHSNTDDGFPGWAIALIVVLGFLAFLSMAGLGYLLVQNYRNRRQRQSLGSSSPMMVEAHSNPQSPVTGTSATGHHYTHGPLAAAGAGMAVRSNDGNESVSDAGPFSGQDAAIMADAFRKALRKPDFGDRPMEEGESPDTNGTGTQRDPVLRRELAEEGRDIRSVSSVRGVTVEDGSGEGASGGVPSTRKPS